MLENGHHHGQETPEVREARLKAETLALYLYGKNPVGRSAIRAAGAVGGLRAELQDAKRKALSSNGNLQEDNGTAQDPSPMENGPCTEERVDRRLTRLRRAGEAGSHLQQLSRTLHHSSSTT